MCGILRSRMPPDISRPAINLRTACPPSRYVSGLPNVSELPDESPRFCSAEVGLSPGLPAGARAVRLPESGADVTRDRDQCQAPRSPPAALGGSE